MLLLLLYTQVLVPFQLDNAQQQKKENIYMPKNAKVTLEVIYDNNKLLCKDRDK